MRARLMDGLERAIAADRHGDAREALLQMTTPLLFDQVLAWALGEIDDDKLVSLTVPAAARRVRDG